MPIAEGHPGKVRELKRERKRERGLRKKAMAKVGDREGGGVGLTAGSNIYICVCVELNHFLKPSKY